MINTAQSFENLHCSKSTIKTPEQCVKLAQSEKGSNRGTRTTLTLFWCLYC